MVNTEILQKYALRLCNLCNIQELSGGIAGSLDKVDKDYFNNLIFPSWEYLTDVAVTSSRVNRGTSTTSPTVDRLHEPHKNVMTINNYPVVLLQPLQSSDVVVSSKQTDKELSIHKNEQLFQSKKIHSSEKDINLSVSISQENCSSSKVTTTIASHTPSRRKGVTNKILTNEKDTPSSVNNSKENCSPKVTTTTGSLQTPGRKRVTLDSFLIPPAKRSNVNLCSEIQSDEDCVIVDSK
ncbi:unnamed protein product [Schistosoma curassoni]|uniref:Uncharacterized protein n=1 Tax=Schistosoma curassoni TaxID=6186 RepID=A0A183L245_9TREM|nr:unnamed protein product [Schistosoma curassoni]